MATDLTVDKELMNTAAAAFRTLPGPLDGARARLYPLNLNLGVFDEGTALVATITSGASNFETALRMYSSAFVDLDAGIVNAATVLTDADESNNEDAATGIASIGK